MVAKLKFALFSFVLLATLLVTGGARLRDGRPAADVAAGNVAHAGRDTHDTSRIGYSSTEIGGTATDASFQSVDRKNVDEATIVLWSRRRLGYICHDDTRVLCRAWEIRLCTEMETAALAVEAVLNSPLRCCLTNNSDPKHFPTSSLC